MWRHVQYYVDRREGPQRRSTCFQPAIIMECRFKQWIAAACGERRVVRAPTPASYIYIYISMSDHSYCTALSHSIVSCSRFNDFYTFIYNNSLSRCNLNIPPSFGRVDTLQFQTKWRAIWINPGDSIVWHKTCQRPLIMTFNCFMFKIQRFLHIYL